MVIIHRLISHDNEQKIFGDFDVFSFLVVLLKMIFQWRMWAIDFDK